MAASNDSQGLKIAVAIFVSLTVILAVAAYFLYSEYDKASQQLAQKTQELSTKSQEATRANNDFLRLRDRAGYQAVGTNTDQIMTKASEDQEALIGALQTHLGEATNALAQAQQAGQTSPAAQQIARDLEGALERFRQESLNNPTFKDSMGTLADITGNQAKLTAQLAADNIQLRQQLVAVNGVNQNELDVQEAAAAEASTSLQQEHQKYENLFTEQRDRIDTLSTQLAGLRAENDQLNQRLASQKADYEGQLADVVKTMVDYRTMTEKNEVVLDNADGYITFVDYTSRRLRTNLTRSMGARPQMIFAVYDRDAPGLPSDEPKARIELIEVTDQGSVAIIQEAFDKTEPIRYGDQVYSAAWSPTDPQRFALIGKIDMNRDGRDDREDLKRLIKAAGGIVDYDLPPQSIGQEHGELTARDTWYVVDELEPIRTPGNKNDIENMTEAQEAFAQRRTEVIEQARRLGVRPLPIQRLLSSLGYSHGMLIPGQVEARDNRAIDRLLHPEGMTAPRPGSEEFEQGREEGARNAPDISPFGSN